MGNLFTYSKLHEFLDRYAGEDGMIQGDPAVIAADAAKLGLVEQDENFHQHVADRAHVEKQVAEDTCSEHGEFCCAICFDMTSSE